MTTSARFPDRIVCSYLFTITKHGYPPPAEGMPQHLREMQAMGFTSVELEGIRREHLLEVYQKKDEIARTARDLGLQVPIFCTVLPGLASWNRTERQENLSLLRKGCEVARSLGSRTVLDNGPLPPYRFSGDIPVVRHYDADVLLGAALPADLNWKEYWKSLIDTYRAVCDTAADYGLTYTMHPSLGVLSATTDGFLHLSDAIGRPNLRFVIDTANQFLVRDNLALSVCRLTGLVDYIHLSDNGGTKLEHLAPGKGVIPWDSFFNELAQTGFDGLIGIDVGGAESGVIELEKAYTDAAHWLMDKWPR